MVTYTPKPVMIRPVVPLVVDPETALAPHAQVLIAMKQQGEHVYAGTVPAHVIERRRKAGKAAKIARRFNRDA